MLWKSLCFSGALVLVLALGTGCGSSGAAGRVNNTFRENLGAYPGHNVIEITDDALQSRYGYRFTRRVESGEDIYFETDWKDATALEDERAIGVDFVRMKIYVSARPRNRVPGTSASFTTTLRAEIESRINATGEWKQLELTPQREEYFEEIADYMKRELRIADRN